MTRRTRILTVDDSMVMSHLLATAMNNETDIDLIGQAHDGKQGLDMALSLQPDAIALDIEMPYVNGLEFLEQLMSRCPIPTIVFSSHTAEGTEIALRALELGAFDFLQKPRLGVEKALDFMAMELIPRLRSAAASKPRVIGQALGSTLSNLQQSQRTSWSENQSGLSGYKPLHRNEVTSSPSVSVSPSASSSLSVTSSVASRGLKKPSGITSSHQKIDIIAIGSSTGGVSAVKDVLEVLPAGMPPIVITQHMPDGYTARFAERLDRICAMRVKEAENGEILQAGTVYIAPGHSHLKIIATKMGYTTELWDGPLVTGHKPSADVMFESVATAAADKAIGVILTGMGKDGAKGLMQMRQKGCNTFGQNKETCVVYGMPKAAFELGAVVQELPIGDIGNAIISALSLAQKTALQKKQG